mmetsp:Transcript_96/g.141  ORF Transcript_96/g.141 Transcript_96/m.141 type:complete len:366 (-) Transcript_96:239-1336(-)|eukprot:CAMPEP_0197309548 /NCGR_PEP_ID=MMETSP0891-20130614/8121_1 /TAXON_ID=44058 ORGANISM="Aureoumbra lagunensis, Strain CCMP1510" /NCGR_SAMPLE_ID=MMETSP0891 /ASSEMBLY_ACC=CAM_ASM_000534 /LENGTH=365 /DNA_ID=CAMNT_0042794669 /DNA_START=82 /DNA_END=1179 /DNA_ORIENTATION=-
MRVFELKVVTIIFYLLKEVRVSQCEEIVNGLAEDVAIERSLRDSGLGTAACIDGEVPVIDMSRPTSEIEEALFSAAQEVGFFSLINHGIDEKEIEAIFDTARHFFNENQTKKTILSPYEAKLNAGYEYMAQVRPSTGLPDVKESMQITTRETSMIGRWPSDAFETETRRFIQKAHALALRVLSLLEKKATPNLKPGTLPGAHSIWTEDSQCTLRMLHYPPIPQDSSYPPGSMRAGSHTDWDAITLLFQLPGNEGLECAANPRLGKVGWIPVDPVQGGVAVNIGDMLARWSDSRLLSNLHRVRMPNNPAEQAKSRYSIAYFAQADKSQIIEIRDKKTGKMHTITAGEYITGRIKSNFEDKFESDEK